MSTPEISKQPLRDRPLLLIGIKWLIVLAIAITAYSFYAFVYAPVMDVRNPGKYADVLANRWPFPELTAHFPESIPGNAADTRFFYRPSWVNRTTYIQLRCKLPHETVGKFAEQWKGESLFTFAGGDLNEHANKQPGVLTTSFFTGDWRFPDDYSLYVLKQVDISRTGTRFKGASGVAVSVTRDDVVYWATVE